MQIRILKYDGEIEDIFELFEFPRLSAKLI